MDSKDAITYEDEVNQIPRVAPFALALIDYAKALASDRVTFDRKANGW